MSKAKKIGAVRKTRGSSGATSAAKSAKVKSTKVKTARKPARGKKRPGATDKQRKSVPTLGGRARRGTAPTPITSFRVRELDPIAKCGAATSVRRLFRVDESNDGVVRPHLVFLDQHGWYCEHGRDCPAVPHARTFGDRARHTGPTQNGRMRA